MALVYIMCQRVGEGRASK